MMAIQHLSRHTVYFPLILGLLVGCTASTSTDSGNPGTDPAANSTPTSTLASPNNAKKVIATTSVICNLTQTIAQTSIDLNCLMDAGTDPHVYEPTPDDRKAIESADLILYGGYDFEPSLIKLVQSTSNPAPKIAVHEQAVTSPIQMVGEHDHGHGDDDHEDEHKTDATGKPEEESERDPHVWHNAQNGIRMTQVIQTHLAKIAPDNAATYTQTTQALTQELTQLDAWIKAQVSTIPAASRKLVTTHDSLGYYAAAYGIPVEGALFGVSTDEKPTALRVKELVDDIRTAQVPTIFAEVTANPNLLQTVANDAQVKISDRPLFTDGLGAPGSGAETYPQMLIHNTQTIVEGLGGKFTPFQAPKN
jgi:manganese/iron transport system substrate-binding protein